MRRLPAHYEAAISPIVGGVVMVVTAPFLSDPVIAFVAAPLLALGAIGMSFFAWLADRASGVVRLRHLGLLTLVGVIDLVHFTVRVAGWLHGEVAFFHPALVAPTGIVLLALVVMWRCTPVSLLLAQPR